MDSTSLDLLDSCVDSSRPLILPSYGDSNIKIKESQLELKEEEFDEHEAYEELYTWSLEVSKNNKRLKEESKRLNKELVSSKNELREKDEVINCVDSKFMISLHNLYNAQDELNSLKIDYENLNMENSKLRDQLQRQDKDTNNLESKLTISKENLSNAQNELNEIKINCDELNNENLNLRDTIKRQDENIDYLKSKLTISNENLSNGQNNVKTLELGSNVVNELESKLKLAYEELNKFKGIEIELTKVKNENSTLKTQVTQLESYKQKYECKFTHGEHKFEKLFKLGKSQRDRTGLGYDRNIAHDPKFTNTFVKGESSFSSTHTSLPKTKCNYCGIEGHFRFECQQRKRSYVSKPIFEPKKVKSNSMMVKILKIKEDSKKAKQVKPINKESPKIDSKKIKQVKSTLKESINKKLLNLPPITHQMKELLNKVAKLNLKFKSQLKGGNKKKINKSPKKKTHQPQKTNHQSKLKLVKSHFNGDKSKVKVYQVKSPKVGETSYLDLKVQPSQDLRWIPKFRHLDKP